MSRSSRYGLSLIEVVIAIAVLSSGILATVAFQTSTLNTNRQAQTINQLTRLAVTEMELRRQTLVEEAGTFTCVTTVPAGFDQDDCSVEILPCTIVVALNGTDFACDSDGNFATFRLVVEASGHGETVQLRSLFGGFYVSGLLSGGE